MKFGLLQLRSHFLIRPFLQNLGIVPPTGPIGKNRPAPLWSIYKYAGRGSSTFSYRMCTEPGTELLVSNGKHTDKELLVSRGDIEIDKDLFEKKMLFIQGFTREGLLYARFIMYRKLGDSSQSADLLLLSTGKSSFLHAVDQPKRFLLSLGDPKNSPTRFPERKMTSNTVLHAMALAWESKEKTGTGWLRER